ncbi:YjgN family protein [Rhizobacter sp. P5_C2]
MTTPHDGFTAPDGDQPAQSASIDSAGLDGVVSTLDATLPPATISSGFDNSTLNERLPIRFTGSGSEYFRIWIVNLLLTLVTAGLYFPWAKVRRLRYFYGNTLVAGQPLGFHGDPKKMLRGYLLVALLGGLYSAAGSFSPVAGLVAFVIVALLWPALFKSSLQFRLANTSWRGLRFRFTGSVGGAYRALLPVFAPSAVLLVVLLAVPDPTHPPGWYGPAFGAVMGVTLLAMPLLMWNLKKYQHDHYAFAQLQTELRAGPGAFYGLCLKSFGVWLLSGLGVGLVLFGVFTVIGSSLAGWMRNRGGAGSVAVTVFSVVVILALTLLMQVFARPYFTSRFQNLLWSRTGNKHLRFKSELRFGPLLRTTLLNWLLMVVTLGLYWPFARVALTRLRLESVGIVSRTHLDALVAQAGHEGDAAGDAAGDFFGIDVGL